MRGRYFRYLFENPDGGLFHAGSVYDKDKKKIVNFVYMAGSHCRSTPQEKKPDFCAGEDACEGAIDLLIVGSYSANYIKKLLVLFKTKKIIMAVLPYLAPLQRLVLAEDLRDGSPAGGEAIRFLQDPYRFIEESGVETVYFIYGNGKPIQRDPEELERGIHFDLLDHKTLCLIREMEGYTVPVMRAGYIADHDFLFYFGVYGIDLQLLSNFVKAYFSHMDNVRVFSENANKDYARRMKQLVQIFLRRFGRTSVTTVVLFEGPLHASPGENESFFTGKEFSRPEDCGWEGCEADGSLSCVIRCTYSRDYDHMQRYKRGTKRARFGMLMLGNINLNRYLFEILTRFSRVMPQIRGICIPNCGSGENWNHRMLEFFRAKDRIYWICAKHAMTSAGVVSDIVLSSSHHRLLPLDGEWGYCLSGYIIPKEGQE